MIKEAELHAEEDKKRRELIDLKNEADNAIHNTETSLNEHRSKIGSEVVEEIETEITKLRNLMNEELGPNDVERVKEQVEAVRNAAMKIGKAMYANQGAEQSSESQNQEQSQEQNQENKQ